MKATKRQKITIKKNLKAKLNISAVLLVLAKKIKNNFIAYYLLLTNASPRKLSPFYHTFIYTLIRNIALPIINFNKVISKYKINRVKVISYLPSLSKRGISAVVIIAIIFVQVMNVGAFEAHVVNVTATIVNDLPLIEPNGGEFCNIAGATITITPSYATSTIIYTINGSDPVCPSTGTVYTAPFTIYSSATVKARACHDGHQSGIINQYFNVSDEFCPPSNCQAETINYWSTNGGCEQDPAVSQAVVQINNLSENNFKGAFSAISGGEICTAFDLTSCPAEGTLEGELCRARGQALTVMSNVVTGRLDLNAVIAGAFDNSINFINLNLTASSTIEQALNTIENIIVSPSHTITDLGNAKFVAYRIYTFYNSENPYAPEPTCIYYEPGEIVLNEFVPNPSCSAQPVDVTIIMDRSGSMGYTSQCDWWELKCLGDPNRCELGYEWVQHTDYDYTKSWCDLKNKPAPYESVWTGYDPIKITAAKQAAKDFLDLLGSEDQSSLVSYATTYSLDKLLANDHAATKTAIDGLITGGATNIGDAIALANTELTSVRANPAAAKVEILLTDGMANKPYGPGYDEWPADVAYAKVKADEAAAQGIQVFTIGLGSDVNTAMLQYIATTTGANYYFDPTGADLIAIYTQISEALCNPDDDNSTGLTGEWAEIYNNGTSQQDLANWLITNAYATSTISISASNSWDTSTIIGATGSGDEWLVVLFNQARLKNNGDTIFLYDDLGHLIDFYSYANSIDNDSDPDPDDTPGGANTLDGNMAGLEGKSFARIPDGIGEWIDPIPTPGGPNLLEDNLILFNELVDETASTSPETVNLESLAAQEDTTSSSTLPVSENNPVDQPVIDSPAATSNDTSTSDSVSAPEYIEPEQPAEEEKTTESTEELITEDNDLNNDGNTDLPLEKESIAPENNQPEEVSPAEQGLSEPAAEPEQTSAKEPEPDQSTVMEAPQQPAVEPSAMPAEAAAIVETTTM